MLQYNHNELGKFCSSQSRRWEFQYALASPSFRGIFRSRPRSFGGVLRIYDIDGTTYRFGKQLHQYPTKCDGVWSEIMMSINHMLAVWTHSLFDKRPCARSSSHTFLNWMILSYLRTTNNNRTQTVTPLIALHEPVCLAQCSTWQMEKCNWNTYPARYSSAICNDLMLASSKALFTSCIIKSYSFSSSRIWRSLESIFRLDSRSSHLKWHEGQMQAHKIRTH